MRLYVIGPVSGLEEDNRPAFEDARGRLLEAGYEVEIPHDTIPPGTSWQSAMKHSIKRMFEADAVAMIDGVLRSEGATIERDLCRRIGVDCLTVGMWCERPLEIRRKHG